MNTDRCYDLTRRGMLRSLIGGSIVLPGVVSQLLADDEAFANAPDPLAPK